MSMTVNVCTNIIHLTYYGSPEENLQSSEAIYKYLKNKFDVYFDEYDEDGLITDYQFASQWTAPLSFLDELSMNFKVDIIGVAYEFEDGYVESFEILTKLDDEDITGSFINTVTDSNIEEGVDTIILPENELHILDEQLEEDVNVSDKEMVDWKEKEYTDWQKRVVEEYNELSLKVEKLKEYLTMNEDVMEVYDRNLLYEQLDAMIDYRFILDQRITKFI